MANYTKVFDNPYPNGWKDLPDESTPITASALQQHTDTIENIEQYLEDNPIGSGSSTDIELTKAEYDAIGDEKLTNGINYFITDLPPSGGGGTSGIDYSTQEQYTGQKWIDGKKIYQRTFYLTPKVCQIGWNTLVQDVTGVGQIKNGWLTQSNKIVACDINIDQNTILECYLYRAISITSSDTLTIQYTKVGE